MSGRADLAPAVTVKGHDCLQIVSDSLSHLFGLILPGGKFVYAHRQYHKAPSSEGYNLLRHCGTVWFMLKAIRLTGRSVSESERGQLHAAVSYIVSKLKEPAWADSTLPTLCLTSNDIVKLGGTGLALLMLNEYAMQDSGSGSDPGEFTLVAARLENFLVSQLIGADFIHKRTFSTGAISPFRSDYYTGEALFPLMHAGRQFPQIRNAMEMLMSRGYGIPEQSHWMTYAACAAVNSRYCRTELTADYLTRLMNEIIQKPDYRYRHQSTPTACRSEALAEFLNTAAAHDPDGAIFPHELRETALHTLEKNLALQLEYYGQGQFRKGRESDKVQIDYIQHNGASFLGYLQARISSAFSY